MGEEKVEKFHVKIECIHQSSWCLMVPFPFTHLFSCQGNCNWFYAQMKPDGTAFNLDGDIVSSESERIALCILILPFRSAASSNRNYLRTFSICDCFAIDWNWFLHRSVSSIVFLAAKHLVATITCRWKKEKKKKKKNNFVSLLHLNGMSCMAFVICVKFIVSYIIIRIWLERSVHNCTLHMSLKFNFPFIYCTTHRWTALQPLLLWFRKLLNNNKKETIYDTYNAIGTLLKRQCAITKWVL